MTRMLTAIFLLALLLATPGAPARSAQPANQAAPPGCGYSASVAALLAQVDVSSWSAWIRQLSGADPVTVGGQTKTITTRYSPYLFNGVSPAYDFVKERIMAWYPEQVEEISYPFNGQTWKNLVLTIPGYAQPRNIAILTAHLDSFAYPYDNAPGAEDNATGVATLLEAARVLQGNPLPNSIRLIWFTGEEQGLRGSQAYVNAVPSWNGVIGVVNVDMFGYDSNNDRCFELHVGTLPASNAIGSCFIESIEAYNMDLKYDYITTTAIARSDHASFWGKGIGAVEVLENYRDDQFPTGCTGSDPSPYYHKATDTIDKLNLPSGFEVARAALATTFSLAAQHHLEWYYFPFVMN